MRDLGLGKAAEPAWCVVCGLWPKCRRFVCVDSSYFVMMLPRARSAAGPRGTSGKRPINGTGSAPRVSRSGARDLAVYATSASKITCDSSPRDLEHTYLHADRIPVRMSKAVASCAIPFAATSATAAPAIRGTDDSATGKFATSRGNRGNLASLAEVPSVDAARSASPLRTRRRDHELFARLASRHFRIWLATELVVNARFRSIA